jgi:secreted trypsin-like serine protease
MIRIALTLITSILLGESTAAMVGPATPGSEALARRVVAITGADGSVCTGTAIARDLILTAAHCVRPGYKYWVVELTDAGRLRRTTVAGFKQHPQFDFEAANSARPAADLALLKLAKPLLPRMTPAPLDARNVFPAGDEFTVAGFGSVSELGDGTFGRLLAAELMAVHHQSDLQIRLVDPVTHGESPGRGACSGDSGGPVFEVTSTGLVLVGVVSWGVNVSGNPGCGGVTGATPIALVRPWIAETAKRLGSPL